MNGRARPWAQRSTLRILSDDYLSSLEIGDLLSNKICNGCPVPLSRYRRAQAECSAAGDRKHLALSDGNPGQHSISLHLRSICFEGILDTVYTCKHPLSLSLSPSYLSWLAPASHNPVLSLLHLSWPLKSRMCFARRSCCLDQAYHALFRSRSAFLSLDPQQAPRRHFSAPLTTH